MGKAMVNLQGRMAESALEIRETTGVALATGRPALAGDRRSPANPWPKLGDEMKTVRSRTLSESAKDPRHYRSETEPWRIRRIIEELAHRIRTVPVHRRAAIVYDADLTTSGSLRA